MTLRYMFLILIIILLICLYRYVFYNPFWNKNVIIVGNSRELLNKEMGTIIDGHDIVIRLNHFKIGGYEKYTGTHTDGFHMNFISIPAETIHNVVNTNNIKWIGTRNKPAFCEKTGLSRFDRRIFQYDMRQFPCNSPTSGTAALIDIVDYCNRPVSIIGLGGYSEPGYYYDETRDVMDNNWNVAYNRHCPEKEKALIENLIQMGKVRRLVTSS